MVTVPLRKIRRLEERWQLAALIDVETTGLSRHHDEVVELAVILFAFERASGRIMGIVDEYDGLRDPGRPIPKEATAVHGIRDRDVRGKRLNNKRARELMHRADFLVAHNAPFDRGFVERLFPEIQEKYWACSMNGVPWRAQGFPSRGLQNLLRDHGLAPGRAHRGADDARTTLRLLAGKDSGGTCYFRFLVDRFEDEKSDVAERSAASAGETRVRRTIVGLPLRVTWFIIKAPFLLVWGVLRLPIKLAAWPFRRRRGKTVS